MKIKNKIYEGERALFCSKDLEIFDTTFQNGESPLKESKNLYINNCNFKWKYPLWYCNNVEVVNSTLFDTARSGIWYTNNITIKNSTRYD